VIGYREVPGKPALYGTTKEFLDYFNLKSLTELPSLTEFKNLAEQEKKLQVQLALEECQIGPDKCETIPEEDNSIIPINENKKSIAS
jgi:segregation and condensation protein B